MSQPSITCPKCGMTSYNPNDIRYRYCGNCHEFHDHMGLAKCALFLMGYLRGIATRSIQPRLRHRRRRQTGGPSVVW